jgi:hypothetical protein
LADSEVVKHDESGNPNAIRIEFNGHCFRFWRYSSCVVFDAIESPNRRVVQCRDDEDRVFHWMR